MGQESTSAGYRDRVQRAAGWLGRRKEQRDRRETDQLRRNQRHARQEEKAGKAGRARRAGVDENMNGGAAAALCLLQKGWSRRGWDWGGGGEGGAGGYMAVHHPRSSRQVERKWQRGNNLSAGGFARRQGRAESQ